ncbi:MAG: hypothetical protein KGL39_16750 [Patescibacteria group bacterium]|nr:hypothetical protein [Patescibacteria group bacterium]
MSLLLLFSGGSGSNVTVSITGVAATGAVGTVTPSTTVALAGVVTTTAVGTLTPTISVPLTGVSATGQTGTLSPSISVPLTGVSGTAQTGTVSPVTSLAATGVSATGNVGSVTPGFSIPLTGVSGAGQLGTLTVPGDVTVALTGISASAQLGNLSPDIQQAQTGGGYPYPSKKKYIVLNNGKLQIFETANGAAQALAKQKQAIPDVAAPMPKLKLVKQPVIEKPQEIPIEQIRALVDKSRIDYLLTQRHLAELIAEYENARDEDDIEALLMEY